MADIYVNLVFEDGLSGAVLQRLLDSSRQTYSVGLRYNSGGFGWIKKRINGFNHAAKGMPYVVLTDLDVSECAPALINDWLDGPRHPNLLLRIAVREVESWLLACRPTFAAFLGIQEDRIPIDVDAIDSPKEFIVNLAKRSRKRGMRSDIVPAGDSTARVGPAYNGRLMHFVETDWDPTLAKQNSPSLQRAMQALDVFGPVAQRNSAT